MSVQVTTPLDWLDNIAEHVREKLAHFAVIQVPQSYFVSFNGFSSSQVLLEFGNKSNRIILTHFCLMQIVHVPLNTHKQPNKFLNILKLPC